MNTSTKKASRSLHKKHRKSFYFSKIALPVILLCMLNISYAQDLQDYTFRTGVDASKWVTLTDNATEIFGSSKDDFASSVMNIGFNFAFGVGTYSQFSVNTNGAMRLGSVAMGSSSSSGQFGTSANQYTPKISGCAREIGTCTGGYIKYEVFGTAPARTLVVEYKMGYNYSSNINADVMWQVQLHEDSNKVVLVYGSTEPATTPSGYQTGLGASESDFCIINPTTNAVTFYTSQHSTTYTGWHGASRYYEFVRAYPSCPRPVYLEVENLAATSAAISWTELGTASQWMVEYGAAGFQLGTGTSVVVNDTIFSMTNLTANTEYDFYVKSICGTDDYNRWTKTTFCTECEAITTLPWVADLESNSWNNVENSAKHPFCWELINGGSTSYNWRNTTSTSNIKTGTAAIYYYSTTSATTQHSDWLITPELPLTGNEQLSFWMRNPTTSIGSNYTARVAVYAYTVDPTDGGLDTSNFVQLGSRIEMPGGATEYTEYIVPLTGLTGNVRLAFVVDTQSYTFCIDDVVVEEIPACPKPQGLTASNFTQTSAELSWTGTASEYIIEYGPVDFEIGTGTIVVSASNTYTVIGLNHSTGYEYYVKAVCGNDTSDYSMPGRFRTECGTITTLPWVADLESNSWNSVENYAKHPFCWELINGGSTSYNWRNTTYTSDIKTGTAAIYYYGTTSATTQHSDWLITPELPLTGNEQLSFWMRNYTTSTGLNYTARVAVYAYTVDPTDGGLDTSNFVQLGSRIEMPGGATEYTEYIVPLTGLSGNVRLAFVVDTQSYYFCIDDVVVEELECTDVDTMIYATICANEMYTANGFNTNVAGTYTDTLQTINGCDSIVTLILTVNNTSTGTDVITACDSYTWIDGITYTASNNTATYTLTNAAGCDSVVTLNLTINYSTTGTDVITACDSYTWIDGITYTASNNTATYTLTAANGCDSVVTLNLTINYSTTGTDVITACDSYIWIDGITYTASNNTATYTLTNAAGCDSIVTLNLTINYSTTGTDVITACDSYTWIDGITYTASNNTATYTLTNAAGCDSVVTLNLTINYSTTGTDVITACDSYTWIDGITYTASNNTATYTLTAANGCDSVVTLNLTINYSTTGTDVITACDSYIWIDGITYTASNNTATYTLTNAAGCDSIVTLNLTISNSTTGIDVVTACGSYTWINGVTYTASNNTATYTLTNAAGCDSVVTLNLTINNSTTGIDVVTACDSYTWINGVTYTASNNTATDTLTNVAGCDSVVTLNLTITNSTTGTDVVTACNSYTWIDGVTYTESNNTATYTLTAANGCDSVVTLNLTINNSTTGIDVVTACDSYTWIDGVTYTESTDSATYTLTNAAGCDSVVTLNLTINYSTTGIDVITACDSYTWIDGVTYTESNNTATYTLTAANGCDSVVTLNLTINYAVYDTIVDTAVNEYVWNGTTYTESGVYQYSGTTAAGCDSIVTLILTIQPIGIETADKLDALTFYPNPTRGTITFNNTNIRKVEVMDGMGRVVATFEDSYVIDLSNLSKGYYVLRITTPEGVAIRKVVRK